MLRERKTKIRTWEKMKTKLKARFLPRTYVQDCYSQLHNLNQGNLSVEEYTREFDGNPSIPFVLKESNQLGNLNMLVKG